MICPTHDTIMLFTETQWGNRHFCPEAGCTMVWWEESDGTPADEITRQHRKIAHVAFDQLWKSSQVTRPIAYRLLSEFLELSAEETHISLFGVETCRRVIEFADKLPLQLLKEKWC